MALIGTDLKIITTGSNSSTLGDMLGGNCFYGASSGTYRSLLSSTLNAVFPEVTLTQAANGQIDYFCVGVINTNAASISDNTRVWLSADSTSPDTSIQLGIGTSGIVTWSTGNNTTIIEPRIASRFVTPSGVTFANYTGTITNSLLLGTLQPAYYRMFWIKRTVNPGAATYSGDNFTLNVANATS
jgi:hypothetical protein